MAARRKKAPKKKRAAKKKPAKRKNPKRVAAGRKGAAAKKRKAAARRSAAKKGAKKRAKKGGAKKSARKRPAARKGGAKKGGAKKRAKKRYYTMTRAGRVEISAAAHKALVAQGGSQKAYAKAAKKRGKASKKGSPARVSPDGTVIREKGFGYFVAGNGEVRKIKLRSGAKRGHKVRCLPSTAPKSRKGRRRGKR